MFSTVISSSVTLCGEHVNYGFPACPRKKLKSRPSRHHSPHQPTVDTSVSLADLRKISWTTTRGHYNTMPVLRQPRFHLSPRLRPGPGIRPGVRPPGFQSPLPVGERIGLLKHRPTHARGSGSCSSYNTNSSFSKTSRSGRGRVSHCEASSPSRNRGNLRHTPGSISHLHRPYFTKGGVCSDTVHNVKEKSNFVCDIISTLVDLKYRWILFIFTLCYIVMWIMFAELYFLDAWLRGDLAHIRDPQWTPCFQSLNSFHTTSSVSIDTFISNYSPRGATSNCIEGVFLMMAQSITKSVLNSLLLGCVLAKLSKRRRKLPSLLFSQHCVVWERDGRLSLVFDVRTVKQTHMLVAEIRAKLIQSRHTKEGEFIPMEQREMDLGPSSGGVRFFTHEPQTVEHVIDEGSPLRALSSLRQTLEIVVMMDGSVQDSDTAFHVKTSYTEKEIIWGQHHESYPRLEERSASGYNHCPDETFKNMSDTLSRRGRLVRGQCKRSEQNTVTDISSFKRTYNMAKKRQKPVSNW